LPYFFTVVLNVHDELKPDKKSSSNRNIHQICTGLMIKHAVLTELFPLLRFNKFNICSICWIWSRIWTMALNIYVYKTSLSGHCIKKTSAYI